jgi:hypothetical protein
VGEQLMFVDLDFNGTVDVVGTGRIFLLNVGNRFAPKFQQQPVRTDPFAARLRGRCTAGALVTLCVYA